jgi:hypothetical protein
MPEPHVGIAFVHHANQPLLVDGYADRDGLLPIAEGYARVLGVHEELGVPLTVHLSGTLIEALAWGAPALLEELRRLADDGLVELIGGTYAENVMPLFDARFNRRQLAEAQHLYARHLGRPPGSLAGCWIPERVWDTDAVAAPVVDAGYRYVLLDDRLLLPAAERPAFDARGPFPRDGAELEAPDENLLAPVTRACRVAGAADLVAVPISAHMRYWIPPREPEHWLLLDEMLEAATALPEPALLVYADDYEKAAGVAGWEAGLARYEAVVRWLVRQDPDVHPTRVDRWLAAHPPTEDRTLEPGTFFELAHEWGAGEDYAGWWESRAWRPYRERLQRAAAAVAAAERDGAEARLIALAWKHLLVSSHETAWQDRRASGVGRAPAPWARAVAGHAATSIVIADAARWFAAGDDEPTVESRDVDEDGDEEILLRAAGLYAVLTPRYGGRLVSLFHGSDRGGVLSVGNPADHWNFQEALNRYMDRPANHPGALADVGLEHVPHEVAHLEADADHARVTLIPDPVAGRGVVAAKTFLVLAGAPVVFVRYELAEGGGELETELCLSPDYLHLLREGRSALSQRSGPLWRAACARDVQVWAARAPGEATTWARARRPEVGHGVVVRLRARRPGFHILVGSGPVSDGRCRELLAMAEPYLAEAALAEAGS